MNDDILGIVDINKGNVVEVHPEIADASKIDRESVASSNSSTIDVVDLSSVGISPKPEVVDINNSKEENVTLLDDMVSTQTNAEVVVPEVFIPEVNTEVLNSDVVVPSSNEAKEEKKEETLVLDPNNLIGVPMTRQEIYEEKELEKEKSNEEDKRNHSGYFGGPIKAKLPGDYDYQLNPTYEDDEEGGEEPSVGINKLGEEVPGDLSKQYEGFNSHGIEL